MLVKNAMFVNKIFYPPVLNLVVTIRSKQVFPITKYITSQTCYLIYLMECNTCKQSYVGYTTTNLPKRFSNRKSHIKKGIRSCSLQVS